MYDRNDYLHVFSIDARDPEPESFDYVRDRTQVIGGTDFDFFNPILANQLGSHYNLRPPAEELIL